MTLSLGQFLDTSRRYLFADALMHDPAFVRVPEAFRIAIANAAREIASEQMLAAARKPGTPPRRSA